MRDRVTLPSRLPYKTRAMAQRCTVYIYKNEKTFKNEQRNRDDAAKKELILQVE